VELQGTTLVLVAVGEVVFPAIAGWYAGGRRAWAVGPPVLLAVAAVATYRLPVWDVGLEIATWFAGVAARRDPERARTAAVRAAAFLLAASLAAWVFLPPGPRYPHVVTRTSLLKPSLPLHGEFVCDAAYGRDEVTGDWLHLGDSMLVFSDAAIVSSRHDNRFVNLLDEADPDRSHQNLGAPGTSHDVALMQARHAEDVDRIVLYHLPVNDLSDLDNIYPCCREGTLLDYEDPSLPARCPELPEGFDDRDWRRWFAASPAPLVLEAFSLHTRLGAHLRARVMGLVRPEHPGVFVNDDMLRDDHAWDQLDAVLGRFAAEFVAEGVPVTFVVLPDGRAMFPHDDERYDRVRTRVDRAMALCASHGLDCLDAWPAFEEAPPTGSWFMADGFHFASRGHRHFATWLRANLLEAE
jgi:hypothetical protein